MFSRAYVATPSVKSSSTMAECVRLDRSSSSHTMDKSITLPPDEIFRNLENAKRFAIDIGTRKYKSFLCLSGHSCSDVANLKELLCRRLVLWQHMTENQSKQC